MVDNFVTCRRCGSDVCYEVNHETSMHWQCMDCGFYTNTFMLKNSEVVDHLKGTLPDLYKDLLFDDNEGFVWASKTINSPGTGVIFIEGTSVDNWCWCFAPDVIIPETERYRYPKKGSPNEFHSFRTDMNLKKVYGQLDFILAVQESGFLLKQIL
jgi:hypothetical protein